MLLPGFAYQRFRAVGASTVVAFTRLSEAAPCRKLTPSSVLDAPSQQRRDDVFSHCYIQFVAPTVSTNAAFRVDEESGVVAELVAVDAFQPMLARRRRT